MHFKSNFNAVIQAQSRAAPPRRRPSPVPQLFAKRCWAGCLLPGWNLRGVGRVSASYKDIKPSSLPGRKSCWGGIAVVMIKWVFCTLTSDSVIHPSYSAFYANLHILKWQPWKLLNFNRFKWKIKVFHGQGSIAPRNTFKMHCCERMNSFLSCKGYAKGRL